MNKWIRLAFAALALLIVFFSLPFWLPGAVASIGGQVQAKPVNPGVGSHPFLITDGGWMTGTTTMSVQAVPQMIAWLPGQPELAWATATGFSYGAFYDSASSRLFLIEQRNAESKTLLGLDIPERALYPPNAQWPLFLTELDVKTGAVVSTVQLDTDFVYSANGGIGRPVALVGETLYIMKYGSINNLTAFDLNTQEFGEENRELCDNSHPMHVSFVSELDAFVTLCMDYTTGMDSSLALTPLAGEQTLLDLPLLGDEEYMSGNGLVVVGATAYVIDSDARGITEVDLASMSITRSVNYAENLSAKESSFGEQFVAWLLDQSAGVAHAKRWFAMPALSTDGRTLVVDSGMGLSGGRADTVYVIDLETLQATQELDLNGYPTSMTFGEDGLLYVFLETASHHPVEVQAIDLASGAQSEFEVSMGSSAYEVFATR